MNKAVVVGYTQTISTRVDNSSTLKINFSEVNTPDALKLFGKNGTRVVIALMSEDIEDPMREVTIKECDEIEDVCTTKFKYANHLYLSSFFRTPSVWKAVGTDAEFLSYLRTLPCAFCGKSPSVVGHVRRIANGAGTGKKPEYSAIPLCNDCHQEHHQHGESVLGGKDWFDKQRIEHLHSWCWNKLKTDFGYYSWSKVPYEVFIGWVNDNNLHKYLPEKLN